MSDGNVFFGGVPTEPDVRKLVDRFGTPEPGIIAHEDVEAVLGHGRLTSRYRTVVWVWRRRLFRQSNIDMIAEPGVGFRVLTSGERVDVCVRDLGQTVTKLRRGGRRHASIPSTPSI